MANSRIKINRIAGALGAEVSGVDLSQPPSETAIAEIRAALLEHLVIFFHDQHLTPEQHLAFGHRFGEFQIHDFVEGMSEHPQIIEVRKEPEEKRNFGGGWHTDVSYLERPALGSVLYARQVPETGGDTLFGNQYLAYDALSDGMKRMLDGMVAIHSARRPYGASAKRAFDPGPSSMTFHFGEAAHAEVEHPVVRTHAETGRKALYVKHLHDPVQEHDRGGERAAVALPVPARGAAGIHLSFPVAAEFDRVLGQSLRPAQRGQ